MCRQLLQQVKEKLSLRRGELAATAEPLLPRTAPPIPLHHAKMVSAAQASLLHSALQSETFFDNRVLILQCASPPLLLLHDKMTATAQAEPLILVLAVCYLPDADNAGSLMHSIVLASSWTMSS